MKKKLLLLFAAFLTATVSFADGYFMAGTSDPACSTWCCGEEWNASACPMTDGVYSTTVPAGVYQFKVTQGNWQYYSWGYNDVDETKSTRGYTGNGGNVQFEVATQANITVTYKDWSIILTSDVPFVMNITSWTLDGLGCDGESSEYDFVEGTDGKFTYKVSGAKLAAGQEYNARAYANHTYDVAKIRLDEPITVAEDGLYDIDFTLDPTAWTLVANVAKAGDWTATYSYNIAGGGEGAAIDGWCCSQYWKDSGCPLTGGVYGATVKPGDTYWFKIIMAVDDVEESSKWIGYQYVDESTSQPGYINGNPGYDGNIGFEVKQEGIVTVTCNRDKISLTCSVPFGDLVPNVWVAHFASFVESMELVNDKYVAVVEMGLDALVNYGYTITGRYDGHDIYAKVFNSDFNVGVSGQYKITFTADPHNDQYGVETEFITSADEAVADAIYAADGTIFCSTPFEIFNLAGQNVTSQNGNLSGLYIVKTEGAAKTVSVK